MKLLCWSKPKQKQKSEARILLEKAGMVLGLQQQDPNSLQECEPFYLHIGFVNYMSWQMTVLPLRAVSSSNWNDKHVKLATLNMQEDVDGGLGQGTTIDHFQLSVKFFHANIDFQQECTVRMYSIDENIAEQLTEKESKSGYVQITKYSQEFTVWQGLEMETQLRRADARKRKPTGSAAEVAPRQKQPRHGHNPSRQPLPRVANFLDQIDSDRAGVDAIDALDDIDIDNDQGQDHGMGDLDAIGQDGPPEAIDFGLEGGNDAEEGIGDQDDHEHDDQDADDLLDVLLRSDLVNGESDDEFIAGLADAVELMDDGSHDAWCR